MNPAASDLAGITESLNGMVNSGVYNEWTWIDAINMSMPDFAELGSIDNNATYNSTIRARDTHMAGVMGRCQVFWEHPFEDTHEVNLYAFSRFMQDPNLSPMQCCRTGPNALPRRSRAVHCFRDEAH